MRENPKPKIPKPAIRVGWPHDQVLQHIEGMNYSSGEEFARAKARELGKDVWLSCRFNTPVGPNTHIVIAQADGFSTVLPISDLPENWKREAVISLEETSKFHEEEST